MGSYHIVINNRSVPTISGENMFDFSLIGIIVLHAGIPPVVSQTVLSAMFVSLGVFLVGVGFGYVTKNRESLLQHRWVLSSAVALTLCAISFVMLPSLVLYYGDTDVEFFSSLSGVTILHAVVGAPAVITAIYYVFGLLPKKDLKKWMRWTAALWISSFALGIFLFLQMFGLLPSLPSMPGM
jgi:uncharacterized membrane protein YozB (DUF420 family)